MESTQSSVSPIQLLISKNRFECVMHLIYSKIASFLISHSILSEEQHVAIKKASGDNADRMDDLLTFLYELNSVDAFNHFRNAVIVCGQLNLGESLKMEGTKSDHVLNPEILTKVFNYLPTKELLNTRRVCLIWNDVISSSCWESPSPTIRINSYNDLKHYTTSNTKFCTVATKFRFSSMRTLSEAEKGLWTKFLERFGNNIKSLDLTAMNGGIAELIFSKDIQKFLGNLNRLLLNVSLYPSFVEKTPLLFLARLEHLTIEATGDISENGQMAFLSKFLKFNHKLKSLTLLRHFCVGVMPLDVSQSLSKAKRIESIEVAYQPAGFLGNDFFKAMKNTKLQSIKFVDLKYSVEPIVMHQFLVDHRHTLERITFKASKVLLTDLPKLDNLTYLSGDVNMTPDAFSFCSQFPNLKELELRISEKVDIHRLTKFQHKALRSLCLTLKGREGRTDGVIELQSFLSSCFPNLKKLEIH